jgi:signal transduction histidine kinase
LHDDITQRLALLAVEIGQATLNDPDPSAKVRTARLSKRISEISDDVQAISHDLHSFKLEHLGMLAAMRSFCTEFAGQQQLWIDFVHDEGPFAISNDVALTLFRVLQEALHNAFKHSQGRHFKVELRCSPRDISLQITDWGVGFDPENVRTQSGLGFVSMRERIKLIKGTIEVESKPMAGTVVRARVPADCLSESNRQAEQDDDPIRAIPHREAS